MINKIKYFKRRCLPGLRPEPCWVGLRKPPVPITSAIAARLSRLRRSVSPSALHFSTALGIAPVNILAEFTPGGNNIF